MLEKRPGIGNVVEVKPDATRRARDGMLHEEIDVLVVGAKKLGISVGEMVAAVEGHWDRVKVKE